MSKKISNNQILLFVVGFLGIVVFVISLCIVLIPKDDNCDKQNSELLYCNEQLGYYHYQVPDPQADYVIVEIKDKDIDDYWTKYAVPVASQVPIWLLYENYLNTVNIKYYNDLTNDGVSNDDELVFQLLEVKYKTESNNSGNNPSVNVIEDSLNSINYNENFFYILEQSRSENSPNEGTLGVYDRFGNTRAYINNYEMPENYTNSIIGSNLSYNELGYIEGIYNFNYKYRNNPTSTMNFTSTIYGAEMYEQVELGENVVGYSHDFTVDSENSTFLINDPYADLLQDKLVKIDSSANYEIYELYEIAFNFNDAQYSKLVNEVKKLNSPPPNPFALNSLSYDKWNNLLILNSRSQNVVYLINAKTLELEYAFTSKSNFEALENSFSNIGETIDTTNWIIYDAPNSKSDFFGHHTVNPISYNSEDETLTLSMMDNHWKSNSFVGEVTNPTSNSYYKEFELDLKNKTASLVTNIELNGGLEFQGSAYKIYEGFDTSFIIHNYSIEKNSGNSRHGISIVDSNQNVIWDADVNNSLFYRVVPMPLKVENSIGTTFIPGFTI